MGAFFSDQMYALRQLQSKTIVSKNHEIGQHFTTGISGYSGFKKTGTIFL
jgi:hypothetical protein